MGFLVFPSCDFDDCDLQQMKTPKFEIYLGFIRILKKKNCKPTAEHTHEMFSMALNACSGLLLHHLVYPC